MPDLIRPRRCENCAFYKVPDPGAMGSCRRYPPTVFIMTSLTKDPRLPANAPPRPQIIETPSTWPLVVPANWCGEHKPKVEGLN